MICTYFTDGKTKVVLPRPTIFKPVRLWTGKQIINTILNPTNEDNKITVNIALPEKNFDQKSKLPKCMSKEDRWVIF